MVKPVFGEIRERLAHEGEDLVLLFGIGILGDEGGILLGGAVREREVHVLGELAVEQRLRQRGFVCARDHVREDGEGEVLLNLIKAHEPPAEGEKGLVLLILVRPNLVFPDAFRRGHRRLQRNVGVHADAVIGIQEGIELFQNGVEIHLPVEDDAGVGRVIKPRVGGEIALIRQLRDVLRMAAGLEAVAVVREEQPLELGIEHGLG